MLVQFSEITMEKDEPEEIVWEHLLALVKKTSPQNEDFYPDKGSNLKWDPSHSILRLSSYEFHSFLIFSFLFEPPKTL